MSDVLLLLDAPVWKNSSAARKEVFPFPEPEVRGGAHAAIHLANPRLPANCAKCRRRATISISSAKATNAQGGAGGSCLDTSPFLSLSEHRGPFYPKEGGAYFTQDQLILCSRWNSTRLPKSCSRPLM